MHKSNTDNALFKILRLAILTGEPHFAAYAPGSGMRRMLPAAEWGGCSRQRNEEDAHVLRISTYGHCCLHVCDAGAQLAYDWWNPNTTTHIVRNYIYKPDRYVKLAETLSLYLKNDPIVNQIFSRMLQYITIKYKLISEFNYTRHWSDRAKIWKW